MFGIGLIGRIKRKERYFLKMAERAPGSPRPTGAVPLTAPGAQREGPAPLGAAGVRGDFGVGRGAGRQPRPDGLDCLQVIAFWPAFPTFRL